jgi:hypothetical protein
MRVTLRLKSVKTVLACALIISLAGAGTACSSTRGVGTLSGDLPLCYGPGIDSNLVPMLTVTATQGGRVAARKDFVTNERQHAFSLTLPAGSYELRLSKLVSKAKRVSVLADKTTRVSFPFGGCL